MRSHLQASTCAGVHGEKHVFMKKNVFLFSGFGQISVCMLGANILECREKGFSIVPADTLAQTCRTNIVLSSLTTNHILKMSADHFANDDSEFYIISSLKRWMSAELETFKAFISIHFCTI